ncbi:nucleotidyltransferase domain-containing protein [Candidatus Wolfebacteria bacterium]|nr:nucleotidyltransferase domain-containing protein [Candidatus Wolfebacteria bacterium]
MNSEIKKICDEIVEQNKQDANVLGIMVFGSAARNKFDEYSDIDIYILLQKKRKYSRLNFLKNKYRVDIIIDSMKEAKAYLKEDKNNVRRNTSHMLAHGIIIYQKNKDLEKIKQIAQKNLKLKTKHKQSEILMHKYSIDDFLGEARRDARNNDYLAFGLDSQLLVNNIIELFLKLKGEFFRQPNEMSGILKKLDKKFCRLTENFYRAEKMRIKEKILIKLTNYIYKKSKGPLPKQWRIK